MGRWYPEMKGVGLLPQQKRQLEPLLRHFEQCMCNAPDCVLALSIGNTLSIACGHMNYEQELSLNAPANRYAQIKARLQITGCLRAMESDVNASMAKDSYKAALEAKDEADRVAYAAVTGGKSKGKKRGFLGVYWE